MLTWIFIIVWVICAFFSFYLAFLGFRVGDRGAFLFAAFGVFFGIPLLVSLIKMLSKRSAFFR
ncbi:MAG: hypothetical protein V1758_17225, partial [Pseudomonadota bacterium]